MKREGTKRRREKEEEKTKKKKNKNKKEHSTGDKKTKTCNKTLVGRIK